MSPVIEKLGYQPINGGVLGTGFRQWLKLDRYLAAKNFQIGKVVVLFISNNSIGLSGIFRRLFSSAFRLRRSAALKIATIIVCRLGRSCLRR